MSAVLEAGPVSFRAMAEADLPEVLRMERAGYIHPWTEGIFRDCMRVGYYCRVLERDGTVRGYGVMATAAGESHLLNVCVAPESRGEGLGRAMLQHLLEAARRLHSETMLLEVRPSNKAAVGLYRSMGFNEVGVRRAYYPGENGREDALIMALQLHSGLPSG